MNRPIVADLTEAVGVSVFTFNRILSGSASVRTGTVQRIRDAAAEIGVHAPGATDARQKDPTPRRLAPRLQRSSRRPPPFDRAKDQRSGSSGRAADRVRRQA